MNFIAYINVISGELRILDNHQFESKQNEGDIWGGEEDEKWTVFSFLPFFLSLHVNC